MSNLKNSQVIKHVLQTLVSKIGRRTSEGFATVILDTVLNELILDIALTGQIHV